MDKWCQRRTHRCAGVDVHVLVHHVEDALREVDRVLEREAGAQDRRVEEHLRDLARLRVFLVRLSECKTRGAVIALKVARSIHGYSVKSP